MRNKPHPERDFFFSHMWNPGLIKTKRKSTENRAI